MNLEETRRNWEQFGREDPLWAILTFPDRTNNRWDVDEFFKLGRQEIDDLMRRLSVLNIKVARRRCLDFGCGVGRLTQALCRYFDWCDGVDIAESMIERANELNGHRDSCTYHLNTASDLRLFGDASFDLIYSKAVLQHMEPKYSLAYISEFLRILKSGGVAVFDSPSFYAPLGPLAEGAHRATIQLVTRPPEFLEAGVPVELALKVTNHGVARWPFVGTPYPINLANHWLKSDGSIAFHDDGRAGLPGLLDPGEAGLFNLTVTAPDEPGFYIIELDMVEEGLTWFAERGSRCLRIPVKVGRPGFVHRMRRRRRSSSPGAARPSGVNAEATQPVMEMHCLPRKEVLAAVTEAGGQTLHTCEFDAIGDGHIMCNYIVQRPGQ